MSEERSFIGKGRRLKGGYEGKGKCFKGNHKGKDKGRDGICWLILWS